MYLHIHPLSTQSLCDLSRLSPIIEHISPVKTTAIVLFFIMQKYELFSIREIIIIFVVRNIIVNDEQITKNNTLQYHFVINI